MAITGTSADETLDGTALDDLILGLDGNDVLNGLGGNDSLNGGAGTDSLYGGDGDDTMVVDVATVAGEIFSGDAGTDSIEFRPIGGAALTLYGIGNLSITSVERLVFASSTGSTIQVATAFAKVASSA